MDGRGHKLLLFDFDGVLVDSLEVYERRLKLCLEKIGRPVIKTRADFLRLCEDNLYEAIVKKGIDLVELINASKAIKAIHTQDDYDQMIPFSCLLPVLEKLKNERIRLVWYYPDPLYDLGLHDWLEDEYQAITALTMFGHATGTLIDPSTPETIVRGYAWKMMNAVMSRQFRGPYEYFMEDFLKTAEDWKADAVVFPVVLPCKHSQAMHGFVREACREKGIPLLTPDYEPVDARPVTRDELHGKVGEFLETQVIPYL
jgi:phosphoglycolate phosphatase-like HAD superfamily hydrolase